VSGRVGCRRRTKLRVEIVEECEHGNFDCDAYGRDWNDKEVTCPGGDRREASESELLTLAADLAEKVWWCEQHKQVGRPGASGCIMVSYLTVQGASIADPCSMIERFLLPVGVLVDGPKEGR